MSDPFSIAGSAIGIVAIGFKLCDELVSFTRHIRGEKSELARISDHLDQLADTLENLTTVLDSSCSDSKVFLDGNIQACSSALEAIKKKLQPPNEKTLSGPRFRDKIQYWKVRLTYPFRREEIFFLRQMLESVQQTLHTALLSLILEQQRHGQVNTMRAIRSLVSLNHHRSARVEDAVAVIHPDISNILPIIQPVAVEVPAILNTVNSLAFSLRNLEQRIKDMSLRGISPSTIMEDVGSLEQLVRRVSQIGSKSYKRREFPDMNCHCLPHSASSNLYSKRSFTGLLTISRKTKWSHFPTCPYASYEEARKYFKIQLSVYSIALARKAQIAIGLFYAAGSFSIHTSLRTFPIVENSSPAFMLIHKTFSKEYSKELDGSLRSRLSQLFDQGQATPHVRLPNGATLLHKLCHEFAFSCDRADPTKEENFLSTLNFLAHIMGPATVETDDYGWTCTDYALRGFASLPFCMRHRFLRFANFLTLHGLYLDKFVGEHSMVDSTGFPELISYFKGVGASWAENPDCPTLLSIVYRRSERELEDFARNSANTRVLGCFPLEFATMFGWASGCKSLIQNGAEVRPTGRTYLEICTFIEDKETLQFWLDMRKLAEPSALDAIGDIFYDAKED